MVGGRKEERQREDRSRVGCGRSSAGGDAGGWASGGGSHESGRRAVVEVEIEGESGDLARLGSAVLLVGRLRRGSRALAACPSASGRPSPGRDVTSDGATSSANGRRGANGETSGVGHRRGAACRTQTSPPFPPCAPPSSPSFPPSTRPRPPPRA